MTTQRSQRKKQNQKKKSEEWNPFDLLKPGLSSNTIIKKSCGLKSDAKLQAYNIMISYNNDTKKCEDNVKFLLAVSKVDRLFKLNEPSKLTHLNEVFNEDTEDWSDNPGLPWCEMGFKTKGDIRNDRVAINDVRRFWHFVKLSYFKDNEQMKFPHCMVYSDPNNKDAPLVWKYPATINFGEALFTINLVKSYQNQGFNGTIAYGFKHNPDGHQQLYKRLHQPNNFYVKLYYTDNSVPCWLMYYAFLILCQNINCAAYEGFGVPDARFMFHMYGTIAKYFMSTHIKLENGTCLMKQCGLARDSRFTTLIGSIISAIILEHLSLNIDGDYLEDFVVYETESLARVKSYWDLNVCQDILKNDFGITLNLSKCQISKNLKQIHFMGFKRTYFT